MLEGTHGGVDSGDQPGPTASATDAPPEPEVTEDEQPVEQTTPDLPLDVTFEVLKNRRRRLVLEYLRDAEDTVTIGELAEHIAAIENDTTVQQLNAQQRKRVYIGLYQCHLPKMDDAGVVDFNQDRGRIDAGDNITGLYDYLDVGDDDEKSMEPVYVGSSLAFGALFFGAQAANVTQLGTALVVVFLSFVLCVTCWQHLFHAEDD
jgi:hypothetical protein